MTRLGQEGRARRRAADWVLRGCSRSMPVCFLTPCARTLSLPIAGRAGQSRSARVETRESVAHEPEAPPPATRQRQLEHVIDGHDADHALAARRRPRASPGCSRSSCARPRAGRRRCAPTTGSCSARLDSGVLRVGAQQRDHRHRPESLPSLSLQIDGRERCRARSRSSAPARAPARPAPRRRER